MLINKIDAFHADLKAAMAAVAAKHGMTANQAGRLMYDPKLGTCKVSYEFGDTEQTGGFNPIYLKDVIKHGRYAGFSQADMGVLGWTSTVKGSKVPEAFVFTGMKGHDKVIAKRVATGEDGYIFNAELIALKTGRKKPTPTLRQVAAPQFVDQFSVKG